MSIYCFFSYLKKVYLFELFACTYLDSDRIKIIRDKKERLCTKSFFLLSFTNYSAFFFLTKNTVPIIAPDTITATVIQITVLLLSPV